MPRTPEDNFNPLSLVGKRVLKDFLNDPTGEMMPFGGIVHSYSAEVNWFLVIYEDGDKEELDVHETRLIVERATAVARAGVPIGNKAATKATTKAPAKRKAIASSSKEVPNNKKNVSSKSFKTATNNRATTAATANNKNNQPATRSSKSPPKRSIYTESSSSDEDAEDDSLMYADSSDEDDACSVVSEDNEEEDSGDSSERGDDDDESDLLLPYNPRSSPPGARASPISRENIDRNASGSGAAAAAAAAGSKKIPVKKTTLIKKNASVAVPTTTTNTNQASSSQKKKKTAPKTKRPSAATLALLPPEAEENIRYVYPQGQEPWRKVESALAVPVYENMDLTPAAVKAVHSCKQQYYRYYRQAEISEMARYEALGGVDSVTGKALSRRPDRVTESWMKNNGTAIHQNKRIGYVAGIRPSQRFYARSEMSCVGLHLLPVAGIEYIPKDQTGLGMTVAASIVCAGCYEDDNDSGDEIIFTGEGGNDLLGNKKQVKDQELVRGNAALVGNIRLGLPVRVTRKNKDKHGIYGCVLIFDGLYHVVEYWKELGKEGFAVYRYRLVRRHGQGQLLSAAVKFGGISAPTKLVPLGRSGIVDLDIANGKESVQIPAVNETDDNELPPCTALDRVPEERKLLGGHRGITDEALSALTRQKWKPTVEYVTEYIYTAGIVPPTPPVLPRQFQNDPHAYITQLNHGRLPYMESRNGKLVQLREALPVVYECGPWAGCALGDKCPQATTQQGILYRLEIFKTNDGRGWGVRSLDMIPQFAFICNYFGDVYKADDFDRLCEDRVHDGAYSMDMAVRPDRDWEGNTTDDRRTADTTEYVICGLKKRNIAAFFNHSCAPNCFVQPVLGEHHDTKMPKISIFAAEDIPPFTQLTWDYGEDYVTQKFDDGCKCGAEDCIVVRSELGGARAGGGTPLGSGRKEAASPFSSSKKKRQQQKRT